MRLRDELPVDESPTDTFDQLMTDPGYDGNDTDIMVTEEAVNIELVVPMPFEVTTPGVPPIR